MMPKVLVVSSIGCEGADLEAQAFPVTRAESGRVLDEISIAFV